MLSGKRNEQSEIFNNALTKTTIAKFLRDKNNPQGDIGVNFSMSHTIVLRSPLHITEPSHC